MAAISHPACEHWLGHGEDGSPECCVCCGNPCDRVTVELMVRHRDYDIDLWTRPVTTGGGFGVEPPF